MKTLHTNIPVSELHPYENNPRSIGENEMELLKQSMVESPEMLKAKPVLVSDRTEQYVILSGNQRLEAAKQLGLEYLPAIVVSGWTVEQERKAVIIENTHFGDWNESLSLWADCPLDKWGVDAETLEGWENAVESADWNGLDKEESEARHPDNSKTDYSSKNKEIDIDALDQTMVLKLYYSEDVYNSVKERLEAINPKIENALLNLLDNAS